jgi:hypothetical protein
MAIKEYFEDVYNRVIDQKDNYEKTTLAVGEYFADIYTSDSELKRVFFIQ